MSTSQYEPNDDAPAFDADPADVAEQHTPADAALEGADAGLDGDLPNEADPADVAEQHTPVDAALEGADEELDDDFPDEADPADVAEQRREVPPEDPEP